MNMSFFDHNGNKGMQIALAFVRWGLRILLIVLIIMGIVYVSKKLYALGYETFSVRPVAESAEEGKDVTVVITKKMTMKDVGALLIEAGLIEESEEAFLIQAKVYGYEDKLIPGPYVLNTSMSVDEMLEIMSTPKEEVESDE